MYRGFLFQEILLVVSEGDFDNCAIVEVVGL
jgi:hypothetical protein